MDNSERINIRSLRSQLNEVLTSWWDERAAAEAERKFLGERVAGLEEEVAKLHSNHARQQQVTEAAHEATREVLSRKAMELQSVMEQYKAEQEKVATLEAALAEERATVVKVLNMNSLAELEQAAKLPATPKPLAELVYYREQYQIYRVTEALNLMFFQSFVGEGAEEKAIAATRKLNRAANGFYMLLKASSSRSTVCTKQEPVASEEEEN